eukprot:SAG22_NODE_68_length_22846_cov_32.458258_9_plen_75_part_00
MNTFIPRRLAEIDQFEQHVRMAKAGPGGAQRQTAKNSAYADLAGDLGEGGEEDVDGCVVRDCILGHQLPLCLAC